MAPPRLSSSWIHSRHEGDGNVTPLDDRPSCTFLRVDVRSSPESERRGDNDELIALAPHSLFPGRSIHPKTETRPSQNLDFTTEVVISSNVPAKGTNDTLKVPTVN
jgi:hypothetical protein